MRILIPAYSLVAQVVGEQKRIDGQPYRLIKYVVQCPVEDGVLLYNTLTCSLVHLSPEEAAHITDQKELIKQWFLVPNQHNDQRLCMQIRKVASLIQPKTNAITGYTILTTTGCNARCFYCYEKGTKPVTMTSDMATKVSRFIMSHRGSEKVILNWFGGEPLVNVKVIDQICSELNQNNVPFKSKMTSNGYLFDVDTIQRAKSQWNLQQVQITLDGTEQTYNQVKHYIYNGINAFERVLHNIELLTASSIRVVIRLNVDKHNIQEMSQLISLLHQRFGVNNYLSVYSHELFGKRDPKERAELYDLRMEIEQQIEDCGYRYKHKLQKNIKLNCCMADNDRNVMISPSGFLGKCEHLVDREFFGHIDNDERDEQILRKYKLYYDDIKECDICPLYPQCYRLKMCPSEGACTPEVRKERLRHIENAMKDEYQTHLNKQPHETQI